VDHCRAPAIRLARNSRMLRVAKYTHSRGPIIRSGALKPPANTSASALRPTADVQHPASLGQEDRQLVLLRSASGSLHRSTATQRHRRRRDTGWWLGLRRQSEVVLHAAEHGQRDQLACLRRRLAQLRVRVRDRMQRLGRTRTMVEIPVFSTNATVCWSTTFDPSRRRLQLDDGQVFPPVKIRHFQSKWIAQCERSYRPASRSLIGAV